MAMCWAVDCKHYSTRDNCRFFRFPKCLKERRKWLRLLRRNVEPGPGSFVCSCHFKDGEKKNRPEYFLHNMHKKFALDPIQKSKLSSTLLEPSTSRRIPPPPPSNKTFPVTEKKKTIKRSTRCAFYNCTTYTNEKVCSFFSFPKESDRCKIWIANVGRPDFLYENGYVNYTIVKKARICAKHFTSKMFANFQRSRLFPHAIPIGDQLTQPLNSFIAADVEFPPLTSATSTSSSTNGNTAPVYLKPITSATSGLLIVNLPFDGWTPGDKTVVCSDHFSPECFERSDIKQVVPSIFPTEPKTEVNNFEFIPINNPNEILRANKATLETEDPLNVPDIKLEPLETHHETIMETGNVLVKEELNDDYAQIDSIESKHHLHHSVNLIEPCDTSAQTETKPVQIETMLTDSPFEVEEIEKTKVYEIKIET